MGGIVAYNYAAAHPDQIERLVIVDIGPEIAPAFDQRREAAYQASDVFDSPEQVFQTMRAGNRFASDAELRQRVIHNVMQRDDGKWTWRYDRAFRSKGKIPPPPGGEPQWQLLSTLTCPTLLVRGAETIVLARATAERMARTIPHCRLVEISQAAHTVTADNPDKFIAVLREFLLAPETKIEIQPGAN
jgi:pimeloyl-ACP methyl ester carboxylesterase